MKRKPLKRITVAALVVALLVGGTLASSASHSFVDENYYDYPTTEEVIADHTNTPVDDVIEGTYISRAEFAELRAHLEALVDERVAAGEMHYYDATLLKKMYADIDADLAQRRCYVLRIVWVNGKIAYEYQSKYGAAIDRNFFLLTIPAPGTVDEEDTIIREDEEIVDAPTGPIREQNN